MDFCNPYAENLKPGAPDVFSLSPERDYDICSSAISCNADKDGASVYEVWAGPYTKPCRVLDFSQKEAEQTYDNLFGGDEDLDLFDDEEENED